MSEKLRIKFAKEGRAVYISHLDLMRTMQRAFQRAGYRLKYSEGFNPHPILSVLLPLSVGTSSGCELMDFQLAEDADLAALPEKLTAAMPEGIRILEAYPEGRKVKELKWLGVTGVLEYDTADPNAMREGLQRFYARERIVIRKKTKRGEGESDIAPAIRSIGFEAAQGKVLLRAVISAQDPTLNPDLLVSALTQLATDLAPDFAEFRREAVYDEGMKEFR